MRTKSWIILSIIGNILITGILFVLFEDAFVFTVLIPILASVPVLMDENDS
jgi:hypothetical protein